MKNIFKLMGLALIAGSMMFVACTKDDEGNGGNGNNNNQEPAIADGWKVTFGGDAWTPDETMIAAYEAYEAMIFDAYMDNDNNMPEFYARAYQYGQGEENYQINETGDYAGYFVEDNKQVLKLDYYDQTALYSVSSQTGETTWFGDWWGKEATLKVKAFDATALTMTAVLDATMFDAYGVFISGTSLANAETKALNVTMGNVAFELN